MTVANAFETKPKTIMTIYKAEEIIASHTGGRDSWDSEALREVAEAAIAGRSPQVAWAPEDVDGLIAAFTLINP